jgi:predicted glycosyltransferase
MNENALPIKKLGLNRCFARLVGIGRSCQCPHQLRRITGDNTAAYFDWLGTPMPGLLEVLRRDFTNCFERKDLVISPDRTTVLHREHKLSYRHLFAHIRGTQIIDPAALDREYEDKRTKMKVLAERWIESIQREPTLFVRHDEITEEDARLLFEQLARQAISNRVELLVILPPGNSWVSTHPSIHVATGIPPSGPGNWQGDDAQWDAVIEPFWEKRPIPIPVAAAILKPKPGNATPLIVFQVPNQIGLGHMNRMSCVATAMREIDPEVRFVFVVEGNSHGMLESMGHPTITLPALQSIRNAPEWSEWDKDVRSDLVLSMATALVENLQPSLIVYDCFPSLAFVKAATHRGVPSVLCLRKMKDYPAYMERGGPKLALRASESILVPHSPEEAELPEVLERRAVFVGPIVRALPVDPLPLQTRLGLQDQRVLVITAGGGGHPDTMHFLRLALQAAEMLRSSHPDLVVLLIPGPLFRAWEELKLTDATRVLPFDPHFLETCATADLVFAQAGYNSANELTYLGTPTVMVPAHRGFDDQFERANQLSSLWPHIHTLPEPTPEHLAMLATRILAHPEPRIRTQVPEGAYLAAAHLLHILERL